ncbi:P-loop NTPase fold protein [Amycolatopsis sp. NPDC088138]|uniref:P-loop NTPase fold protein n=1 Tax=Amycolatopsis sp. NPDC088138 TaxID=3363938 RepID=UPI00382A1DA5
MSRARRFVVLNDAPLGDGADEDLLKITQVAQGLADLVVDSRDAAPFTLSVDAAWGMGKSSLLHRLETTLAAEPAVSTVWFNAWTSGKASALEGLIKSVLLGFDRNIIRRVLRSMSKRAHLLGGVRGLALLVGSFFGLGRVVDEVWQRMSLDAQARNQIKGVLRDAFRAWLAKGGSSGGRLLVVFVDDLDRCASERVVEVCEAIKLYLDVPGIVFVLACDQSALWRAVQESAGVGDPAAAVEYLEKIVQISYRIPAPSPEQALKLVDGYLDRSKTSGLFDKPLKDLIIERSGRNPRRIKRLINSFVLEYHLNRSWDAIGLENLVKVIMLQHFYPAFYRLLTNPRNVDLIREFLVYHRFRTEVKQGGQVVPDDWAAFFASKGLRPPQSADELRELEGELPAEYPALATDRDFVALLESFGETTESLMEQLQRRPLAVTQAPVDRPPEPIPFVPPLRGRRAIRVRLPAGEPDRPVLDGLRILWVDDQPANNTELARYLSSSGVRVDLATTTAEAVAAFRLSSPDALLSDFRRGTDDDAGIDDLAGFRREGYEGPVLFFSGKIPGLALQNRIRELRADGPTNDENEVVRWLAELVATRPG